MYEFKLLIFAVAGIASCYLVYDSYKHRNLPIAQPLAYLSIVLVLLCVTSFTEVLDVKHPQWLNQAILDIRAFMLRGASVFLWAWVLLEYYYDKKIPFTDKIVLLCCGLPLLTVILYSTHVVGYGFIDQTSETAIFTVDERGGLGIKIARIYGTIMALGVTLLTPYVVRKRQQSRYPWLEILLVMSATLLPYALLQLERSQVIDTAYGALPMVVLLLWASRQYRLLDVLPVALQGVMDKVDAGILVSNVHSKLLYINDYAQKLFKLNVSAHTLEERTAAIPEVFVQHFDFSQPEKQSAQIQTKNAQGNIRYIDAVLQPIFHQTLHKHLGATISLHDITERKQAELELQNFNRQKSEFFAGISHEFRTPLTLSMGNIDDVLQEPHPVSATQQQALLRAKSNNKRLLSLVNQLLELSRLDKRSLEITPVKIRLDDYVPMVIANFESLAEKQNIRMHFVVGSEAQQDSAVYFDNDALDKILVNLISNALKSITDNTGGDVYITLNHAEGGQIQLAVQDTGCGIPADALSKIFEMFYSHQMNNTAWPPGTGVGLSLVKQLLLLHGGDISVSSTQGHGSCFTMKLRRGYGHFAAGISIDHTDVWEQTVAGDPKQQSALLPESIAPVEADIDTDTVGPAPSDDTHKHILLSEDNADMRRYIRKHLADFQLSEVADGEAALALAQQIQPDLVLSDVMMPKMNGYDLCKQLKSDARTSHIPVVLLTARSDQTEKLEGLALGADDYISKPFDVRELNLRIHNLINARQTLHTFYQANGFAQTVQHPELPRRETAFLEKLRQYVLDNIESAELKIADLAAVVHMSERSLSRKVKALTGDTPKKMLLTIRLEQAASLLTESADSITTLGYQVGFSDASHFTRSFKAHFDMTPSEYRENRQRSGEFAGTYGTTGS